MSTSETAPLSASTTPVRRESSTAFPQGELRGQLRSPGDAEPRTVVSAAKASLLEDAKTLGYRQVSMPVSFM